MDRGINIPEKISRNLQEIRDYPKAKENSELQEAHHFLYAVPWKHERDYARIKYDVLVISMQPGESEDDWKRCEAPAEESMECDFLDPRFGGERAIHKWVKKCRNYLGFEMPVLETAFFFWSSRNTGKKFSQKFDYKYGSLSHSRHWEWCKDKNLELIDAIRPKLIVAIGIGEMDTLASLYELQRSSRDALTNEKRQNLAVPYVLPRKWEKIDFEFIQHPGAWLIKQDRNRIKEYLAARLSELGLV